VRYVVIHITQVPLGVTVAFPRQKGPLYIRAISALGVPGTELGEWADVASERALKAFVSVHCDCISGVYS